MKKCKSKMTGNIHRNDKNKDWAVYTSEYGLSSGLYFPSNWAGYEVVGPGTTAPCVRNPLKTYQQCQPASVPRVPMRGSVAAVLPLQVICAY